MSASIDLNRLDVLILARLALAGKKPLTPGALRKSLAGLVEHALTQQEWRVLLDERLAHLKATGDLEPKGPLRTTADGEEHAKHGLSVTRLPPWRQLMDRHLPATGLGVDPSSTAVKARLRDADGLRGMILRERLDLPAKVAPTLKQAVDALIWRELGVESDRELTLGALRTHMLQQHLGGTRLKAEKLPRLIAAQAVGSSSMEPHALRRQLARDWLAGPGKKPVSATTAPAAASRPAPDNIANVTEISLPAFAQLIQRAADATTAGRYGDLKVFVSAVWRRLQDDPILAGMELGEFKARLVEANSAGLLALHRADLVSAMDPQEVAESEINYLNATFHFVESVRSTR